MKNRILTSLVLLAAIMLAASCEKASLDGPEDVKEVKDGVRVSFSVSGFEQVPFDNAGAKTRAAVSLADVCSRLSFAIYQADGNIYDAKHQESTASGFGTLTVSLPKGSYKIIVIGHSGGGVPTFESWEKVKFKDNKTTDTFYCVKDIEVSGGASYSLELKRAVAMFRLIVSDSIPQSVSRMKFYYTGGSSTFDPISGYGCVNSRQTEYRDVTSAMHGKGNVFEVYSFPHAEEDELKVTVSALDASGETVTERVFEDVPIKRNVITQYRGNFFGGSGGSGGGDDDGSITFDISFDADWTTVTHAF